MRHSKTKKMMDYWMTLFAETGFSKDNNGRYIWPERSSIQPAACHDLLGDMFILDIGRHESSYRLAGTRLCAMHGRELKNENFSASFEDRDQRTADNWASGLGGEDYAALICSDACNALGDVIPLETLLLPLNHHGSSGLRAAGITVALETPFWLGSLDVSNQIIRSVRLLRPWEDAAQSSTASEKSFQNAYAKSSQRLQAAPPPIAYVNRDPIPESVETNVPYLRVLQGGRQ